MDITVTRHKEDLSCEELHKLMLKILNNYLPYLPEVTETVENAWGTLTTNYCDAKYQYEKKWYDQNDIGIVCKKCGTVCSFSKPA